LEELKERNVYHDTNNGLLFVIPTSEMNSLTLCNDTKLIPNLPTLQFPLLTVYMNKEFHHLEFPKKLNMVYMLKKHLQNDYVISNKIRNASQCAFGELQGRKTNHVVSLYTSSYTAKERYVTNFLYDLLNMNEVVGYTKCHQSKFVDEKRRMKRSMDYFKFRDMPMSSPLENSQICMNNIKPIAKVSHHSVEVPINKFEYIRLKSDLFFDAEDGNANNLKVDMKWRDGQEIIHSDWLQYNSILQLMYTWATYNTFLRQPNDGYSFILTATDKCGSSVFLVYKIKIRGNEKPPCYATVLLVESNLEINTPFPHILGDMVQALSIYYKDDNLKNYLIQSLTQKDRIFSLLMSDKRVSCNPCDQTQIERSKEDAKQSKKFKHCLMPNFKYLGVTVKWDSCTGTSKPLVLYQIPELKITGFGMVKYLLSQNTFYDANDGFTPSLQLNVYCSKPEISVAIMNGMQLYIYQLQSNVIEQLITVIIEATNSNNLKTRLMVTTQSIQQLMKVPGYFSFQFLTYYEHFRSDGEILAKILTVISEYLQVPTNYQQFVILAFSRTGAFPQAIKLSFSMREFYVANGGYQAFLTIRNKLFFNGGVSNLFVANIIQYIREISGQYYDNFSGYKPIQPTQTETHSIKTEIYPTPTKSISNISPSFVPTQPPKSTKKIEGPIARYQIGPFVATFCDFLVFPVPEDLFYDTTDGTTRNLKLTLNDIYNKPTDETSWISVDSDIQVIYGYLKIDDYKQIGGKETFFHLVATNSKGGSTSLLFKVELPEKLPDILYKVTMTLTPFYNIDVPEINEQLMLLTKISTYFGKPSKFSWINIISFNRVDHQNKITMAWTNCTLTEGKCQNKNNDISTIASKVIMANGNANTNFASFLSPQYMIRHIEASAIRICPTSSIPLPTSSAVIGAPYPIVVNKISSLLISSLHYFSFKVLLSFFFCNDTFRYRKSHPTSKPRGCRH